MHLEIEHCKGFEIGMESIIIKTPEQIEGIRKSCKLAAQTLDFIKPMVSPGTSTDEIDRAAEEFIRDHNAVPAPLNYHGYPKSTCISLNEIICHGIPSEKDVLEEGDIVGIDVSTVLDGYFGDTCRTFPVGEVSGKAQDLMTVTLTSMYAGIAQVSPGGTFGRISEAISLYATTQGYSVVDQFSGHGTGIEFHEPPDIIHSTSVESPYSKVKMEPGMIFTIEPMLNVGVKEAVVDETKWVARTEDGKLSAQFEHTILVTESGHEILTIS